MERRPRARPRKLLHCFFGEHSRFPRHHAGNSTHAQGRRRAGSGPSQPRLGGQLTRAGDAPLTMESSFAHQSRLMLRCTHAWHPAWPRGQVLHEAGLPTEEKGGKDRRPRGSFRTGGRFRPCLPYLVDRCSRLTRLQQPTADSAAGVGNSTVDRAAREIEHDLARPAEAGGFTHVRQRSRRLHEELLLIILTAVGGRVSLLSQLRLRMTGTSKIRVLSLFHDRPVHPHLRAPRRRST